MSKMKFERYLSSVNRNLRENQTSADLYIANAQEQDDLIASMEDQRTARENHRRQSNMMDAAVMSGTQRNVQNALATANADAQQELDSMFRTQADIDNANIPTTGIGIPASGERILGSFEDTPETQEEVDARTQAGGEPGYWDRLKGYAGQGVDYAKANPGHAAGVAAIGAVSLGAAAYAMRRVLLKRRANNLVSRVEKLTAECETLQGQSRANCLRQVRAESSEEINELMAQCEQSDDPEKCRSEVTSILNS